MAQEKFGKGKLMSGDQMRWAFENLNVTNARLQQLGATGLLPEIKTSCDNHEGSGKVKIQQWDGAKWVVVSDWIEGNKALIHPLFKANRGAVREGEGHYAGLREVVGATERPGGCLPPRTLFRKRKGGANQRHLRCPSMTLLSVNNIEVIYDHVILVLKGVSLEVPEGRIVALLGANGAGKTTTLKAISNLLHAERGDVTKGSIEYRGHRVDQLTPNDLVKRGGDPGHGGAPLLSPT